EGARLPLYHIDLYRIRDEREFVDAGIEEYIYGTGVSVIEWADNAPEVLKRCNVVVTLGIEGDSNRKLIVERRSL
ncbi:MAG: tRNA (adenosine(37)-N6)-threonylcarbamoyltransferase complex ATPase subunit type 1 TsaE, partial [Deltaproteobacteria bacterium]|nr:tRNA (adenosine(37)-N6)-threonylcarbamoyltransferase complex ATPase subunit type 1 TsaE [Deltaproteobacteria bacterium]